MTECKLIYMYGVLFKTLFFFLAIKKALVLLLLMRVSTEHGFVDDLYHIQIHCTFLVQP